MDDFLRLRSGERTSEGVRRVIFTVAEHFIHTNISIGKDHEEVSLSSSSSIQLYCEGEWPTLILIDPGDIFKHKINDKYNLSDSLRFTLGQFFLTKGYKYDAKKEDWVRIAIQLEVSVIREIILTLSANTNAYVYLDIFRIKVTGDTETYGISGIKIIGSKSYESNMDEA